MNIFFNKILEIIYTWENIRWDVEGKLIEWAWYDFSGIEVDLVILASLRPKIGFLVLKEKMLA